MGRRIIEITPELLHRMFEQDHVVGENQIVRVTQGIPVNAKIVRCWVKHEQQPHGTIVILFEHADWSETPKGEPYVHLDIVMRSEVLEYTP